MSDPSGFITNPPSTVVKVQNTARDDMNGSLGIAITFQQDRGRYLIHNVVTQQTVALKPENLIKASTLETAKAQYLHLRNDPGVQRKIRDVYDKAKQTLHPIKPEYAVVGVLMLWCSLLYFIGFTKTLMMTSVLMLLGIIVAPDVMAGANISTILTNIPRRSRESMEETVPALRGRLSNRMAGVLVVFMIYIAGRSIIAPKPTRANRNNVPSTPSHHASLEALKQEHYKLGFDDAKNGLDFGTSLKTAAESSTTTPRGLSQEDDEFPEFDNLDYPPPQPKRGFGFSSAMSAFFLARTAYELGNDPVAGSFSVPRMVANAKTLEPWKMGMVAFSLYNLVRSFI
jgi:hypothetical protein